MKIYQCSYTSKYYKTVLNNQYNFPKLRTQTEMISDMSAPDRGNLSSGQSTDDFPHLFFTLFSNKYPNVHAFPTICELTKKKVF